jgi:uncharacterized protein YabE (DUF348 family)
MEGQMRKINIKKQSRKFATGAAIILGCLTLSACGSNDNIQVTVVDGQVTSYVSVNPGELVSDVLQEAELTLGEGDEISQDVNSVVSDGEKIEIDRLNKATVCESDGQQTEVEVLGGKVSDALEKAGVTLGEYDLVNHDTQAFLTQGMNIVVTRRFEVTLTVDGASQQVITSADTVQGLLDEQKVVVSGEDRLNKELTASIASGDSVVIERVNREYVTETSEIDFETETQYSDSMYQGETKVSQQGVKGEKETTYEVVMVDGKEESRSLVEEKVVKEPVNQVVISGTKAKEVTGANGKTIVSKEKNYDCDNSGHGWYTITYSDGSVDFIDF